jgi:hypothetical protein
MDDETESWIYLDGPEPEPVRSMLDLLRVLPPATAEDLARMERTFFARFFGRSVELGGDPPSPLARPVTTVGDPPNPPDAQAPASQEDAPPPPRVYAVEPAQPDPKGAEPPSTHAPSALASTSLDVKLPPLATRGGLPFVGEEDLLPMQRATRTRQSLEYPRPGLGETTPPDDDSIIRARAALPFATSLAGAAEPPGGLTLEQYASLRAELAVRPEEAEAEVLAKYHVTARAELDEQWRQYLAGDPRRRADFEEHLVEFTAHVRKLEAWEKSGRT